jgi:DNA-binding beta-propeller fold protein YncE
LLVNSASALFLPSNDQAATLVLGQSDFTSSAPSLSQNGLDQPFDMAVDPTTGKVFVSDRGNGRVLRFDNVAALTNGAAAEAVLGKPDFATNGAFDASQSNLSLPAGLAVDASGRLWVADFFFNRVLRFDNAAAKANGAAADGVLGQPDFTSTSCQVSQSGMCSPYDLALDASGRLWVADTADNRVLRFDDAAAKANGANADDVLGQPDYTSLDFPTTQARMDAPLGVTADASGHLWVSDSQHQRVLRFDNAAAKANGANADGVLGQSDFSSSAFSTTQNGMSFPSGLTMDGTGRLYVAEQGNNRILAFDAAASLPNGANASYVLGQPDFVTATSNTGGISATTLFQPQGLFFDPAAKVLWVADHLNSRVLMYGQPYATLHILPFIGLVRLFLPPGVTPIGSISIQTRDGTLHTFDVSPDVRILPRGRAGQLGVGSFVTLLARMDPSTGHMTVFQIVVHPESGGPGFPTLIPTPTATPVSVPGSVP